MNIFTLIDALASLGFIILGIYFFEQEMWFLFLCCGLAAAKFFYPVVQDLLEE